MELAGPAAAEAVVAQHGRATTRRGVARGKPAFGRRRVLGEGDHGDEVAKALARRTADWPTWRSGTGPTPGSKTGSGPARQPGCATFPAKAMTRTGSSWSCRWPPRICSPGPRRCASTARWRAVNPPRSATASATSPPGWCALAAAGGCAWTETGPGRSSWRPRSTGSEQHPGPPEHTGPAPTTRRLGHPHLAGPPGHRPAPGTTMTPPSRTKIETGRSTVA